jgi:hypothetical protein
MTSCCWTLDGQAAPARVLAGEELSRRLAGKTRVSEFRKASHDAEPF